MDFRLWGINNQNFIMRDEQTGTWWQQVSGLAIHGPLKGKRLRLVPHDQITFATWKQEQPKGQVLKLDEKVAKDDDAPAVKSIDDGAQSIHANAPDRMESTASSKFSAMKCGCSGSPLYCSCSSRP